MKGRLTIPIRLRFMLTFLVLVTAVVGLITFTTASLFEEDKQGYVNGVTSMVATSMAEEAHSVLIAYGERLRLYARIIESDAMSDSHREELSRIVFDEVPELFAVVIREEGGEPMGVYNVTSLDEAGVTAEQLLDFQETHPLPDDAFAHGGAFVRNSTFDGGPPAFTVALEQPASPTRGRSIVYGVMATTRLQALTERFSAYEQFLVDSEGALLAHPDRNRVVRREIVELGARARQVQERFQGGMTINDERNGESLIVGLASAEYAGVTAVAEIPGSAAHVATEGLVNRLLAVAGLLLIVAIVVGVLWAHQITSPMERLTSATRSIAKGDFDISVDADARNEIGVLAGSFNQMASELKQRDEELTEAHGLLVQSEKMAAFGQLGAGIAHEVKNPLAGILACAELAADEVEEGTQVHADLKLIEKESKRCRTIIDNLLKFARQEKAEQSPTDVNLVIRDAVAIVGHQLSIHSVDLECDLAADLVPVSANANQLQQVFINLMINAQQAMEGDGGNLRVASSVGADGRVELAFEDTGPGIPPEIREKLFEPFFTTKAVGKGTGLGLSVSYGIIEEHRGEIAVESEVGQGTTFRIHLPVLEATAPSNSVA